VSRAANGRVRLTRLPKLDGVSVDRADAAWVTCDVCEEQDLLFGMDLRAQIRVWRDDHFKETHGV
jgi:hypothetical protein